MHTLEFSLSNESVARVYDAVLCLAKFGELVSLEARIDRVDQMFNPLHLATKLRLL